jgi:hypothetical protein
MKKAKLEKLSTPDLVERFIDNCIEMELEWVKGDIPELNCYAEDNYAVLEALDVRKPNGRSVLLRLLSHYNLTVRCEAGVCLLKVAPEEALPVLNEIHASNIFPLNSRAGRALLREGYRKAGDRPDGTRDPAIDRIIENARARQTAVKGEEVSEAACLATVSNTAERLQLTCRVDEV